MPEVVDVAPIRDLIERARALGVELWTEGKRLRFRAPRGQLDADLRADLAACREELIRVLQEEAEQRVDVGKLAANQLGVWFLQRLAPHSAAYNVQFSIRIFGDFDQHALDEALQIVVDRHESLRTTYGETDGEPRRHVHGRMRVAAEHSDLRSLSADEAHDAIKRDYQRPFDLQSGPLVRLSLYRVSTDSTVLVFVAHHLVVDGTALFVLMEELFAVYKALVAGKPPPPRGDAATFSEFVAWQESALHGTEEDKEFWQQQLTPFPEPLDLPTDLPRSDLRSMRGASHWRSIDANTALGIRTLGTDNGVTSFVVCLSLWFAFLYRISGRSDVLVGTPVVGRPAVRFAGTIGDLINMLPLRMRRLDSLTFRELLAETQTMFLQAIARQDFPLPLMLADHHSTASLGQPPFQSAFALQEIGRSTPLQKLLLADKDARIDFAGLEVGSFRLDQQEGQFDLSLDIWPHEAGMLACWRFDSDLFLTQTIESWSANFDTMVRDIVRDPDRHIAEYSLLGESERKRQLQEWNATGQDYARSKTVVDLFAEQAARVPDAVAVEFADRRLSYRELDARANRLAHYLGARGVEPGALVGVCLKRSEEMLVAALAILKSGAAYVPLDPEYPVERLRFIVEDAAVPLLLTTTDELLLFADLDVAAVCIDRDAASIADQPATLPGAAPGAEDLAYVIYTSGSTGKPKGVKVPHGALSNFLHSMAREPGLTEDDVLLAVTTLSFDIAGLELYLPLIVGARLVIAADSVLADGAALVALLEESGTTVMQATPATWRLLFASGWQGSRGLKALCGGEALPADLAAELCAKTAEAWNMYGPTETTIWSSCYRLEAGGPVLIGRPIANTQLYVLDEHRQPVPLGVPGELYIGGEGVTAGYHDRPELTAERFVTDPYSSAADARMYRTGDCVRYRANGNVEYLHRLDDQVKVRGYRIELGEIEARLAEQAEIEQAVVAVQEHGDGDQRLVGYYLAEHELAVSELRAGLKRHLPDYMIPQHFMRLDEIPLTPNGKIDRKALPAPEGEASGAADYEAPRTLTEQRLASLWEEVLGVGAIGINDNFFERGGHSLLATRVNARLSDLFGTSLPLRAFFEAPVLSEFAARIDAAADSDSAPASSAAVIDVVPRDGELPISHAQLRLWFLDQLESGSSAYVMPSATRLRGLLDMSALQNALTELVRRHEILRAVFVASDGKPRMLINESAAVSMPLSDLGHLPEEERLAAARGLAEADARLPFDLASGPLYRASILRLGDADHVLLLAFHHIVFDFWSATLFADEFATLYDAFRVGKASPLPDFEHQYVDYVAWQNQRLDSGLRERLLDFWIPALAGDIPPLELPSDRPRSTSAEVRGARCTLALDAPKTAALRRFSQQQGTTVSTTLLALFKLLVYRITGAATIVVGSPVAGRNRIEVEKLIGFFINTVAIRTDLAADATFSELLRDVQEASLGAYEHQEMPFEELVQAIEPERDLRHTPLFQVFFNHAAMQGPVFDIAEVTVEPFGDVALESKFDLTLYAFERDTSIELVFSYNANLFLSTRMNLLIEQLGFLLDQAIAEPDRSIGEYSLDSGPELLPEPAAALSPEIPAGVLTMRDIGEHGDRLALVATSGEWSYALLDRRADALADELLESGLKKGEIVAIYAARDPSLVCAILGVLRAGGAFALFDPAYPDARLAACWSLARPRAAIILDSGAEPGRELSACLASEELRATVVLDEDFHAGRTGREGAPAHPELRADDLAYVAFTSGTTGKVKAVLGSHGPVAHFLEWQRATFGLCGTQQFSMLSGISHDPLLRDVFAPLWCGGTLHIPAARQMAEPADIARFLKTQEIDVTHLTPAMVEMLATTTAAGTLSALRYAFMSGDVLRADTVTRWRRLAPDVECVNFYGATETPQAMSYHRVPHDSREMRSELPLGRGIDGVQLLVINDAGKPAGPGEIGEIVIRTPFLARGYLGDKRLTERQFTANPFTAAEGDRVYRSGDRGRYLPNGEVEFAGRRDGQVKLRGFRIELGELEGLMNRYPGVSRSAAALRRARSGDERLVAYLVADDKLDFAELRAFMGKQLPAYAIPAACVMLDELPLTPNGKLDRRALPQPADVDVAPSEPPRTERESSIAQIFCEVLDLERVGRSDNFFDLGGHSLLGAQVVARVRAALGVELPLQSLFESPTVAELGAELDRLGAGANQDSRPPLESCERDRPLPISIAQERMWYLQQMTPDSAAFNLVGALELDGDLDVPALEKAFRTIVERHEALHTVIVERDGVPVQELTDPQVFSLGRVELRGPDGASRLPELLATEGALPFDLETGPLLRITLYALEERRHVLQIVCHHIVSDAWSMGVFIRDLGDLYRQYMRGIAAELPALPVQYADYAMWQREWLKEDELERQLAYWRTQLEAAPPSLELPGDRPRPPQFSHRGARYAFRIEGLARDRLLSLSRQEGATLFMALLSVFQVLLARYSGQRDVVVGTPVANRMHPELEGLIGFFLNTVVLRTDTARADNFRELLAIVRDTCIGAFSHQELPFERLVEDLQPKRDLSRNPVFQVMFVLQNMELPTLSLGKLDIEPYPQSRSTAQVDLSLYLWESSNAIEASFEYATDLFDSETIERMAGHYLALIDELVNAPQEQLLAVPLLDVEERTALVDGFNQTAKGYADQDTVVSLFREQASRRPEAIALKSQGRSLSYEQLEAQSNRMANYLGSLGVGPESLVGLCLERGVDMVVAALAVLKAGGAYVPLDPAFPAERLHYMLEDSAARVVVTDSSLAANLRTGDDVAVVCVDADRQSIDACGDAAPAAESLPDGRAYVIYTSGSTGKPKGVEIEHRSLSNFLNAMAGEPGLDESDVLYAVTTLSFDISVLELFLPLTVGARVEIADRDATMDGARLARELEECEATIMQATPTTWRILIESDWRGRPGFKALCGGEAFPADMLPELCERAAEVWNMYGPTETTIWSSCSRLSPDQPVDIGKPIANTRMYVLNEQLQPQPVGVPGELYIGGDGVARGYLDRPALNAERFIADPFCEQPGSRMYRTGDLARWRPGGTLEHLGRLDSQVKLRGYRIELGEIESCLAKHPVVAACAVALTESRPDDQRLVAYYVADAGQTATVTELRAQLKTELPAYMIPQHLVEVPELPLTPNGKVDRKSLAEMAAPASSGQEYVEPQTDTESRLAALWAEMLGIDRVGRHDNFFDIGGHSLLAIRVRARMSETMGIDVTLQSLTSDTLSQISAACDASGGEPASGTEAADSTVGTLARLVGRVWRRGESG